MHLSIRISEPERLFSRRCPESPSNYRPVSRADDMRVYFAETNLIKRDEIAARQLHALRQHYAGKLRLTDVTQMFLQMKDHA
jgi:hypothetical protein